MIDNNEGDDRAHLGKEHRICKSASHFEQKLQNPSSTSELSN